MRDKQCDAIRRELEETALNDDFSVAASEHMQACADCREFQRQQMKLRQIIGGLGTVNAPADFDFRLRARLAADSDQSSFRYWSFAVRGLATVAVLVVFGVGAVMVWQRIQQDEPQVAGTPQQHEVQQTPPPQTEQPRREEALNAGLRNETAAGVGNLTPPLVADNTPPRRNPGRRIINTAKQPVTSFAISSVGARVVPVGQPVADTAPVFPIETSLQTVKVSLDDGRGNARTISFPTVTFGSQRMLATGNQLASKHVW
jgi:hypothetical protein